MKGNITKEEYERFKKMIEERLPHYNIDPVSIMSMIVQMKQQGKDKKVTPPTSKGE